MRVKEINRMGKAIKKTTMNGILTLGAMPVYGNGRLKPQNLVVPDNVSDIEKTVSAEDVFIGSYLNRSKVQDTGMEL